jgi:hypothetical protein
LWRLVALIVHDHNDGRNNRGRWKLGRSRLCAAFNPGFRRNVGVGFRQLRIGRIRWLWR